jgi:hypothetical protein
MYGTGVVITLSCYTFYILPMVSWQTTVKTINMGIYKILKVIDNTPLKSICNCALLEG